MAGGIDRPGALDKAFEFIYKSETDGDYFEFGVFQGVSLARAVRSDLNWKKKTGCNHVRRFIGFDSFRGLPSFVEGDNLKGYEVFQPGQFSDTSQQKVRAELQREGMPMDNVTLIPGFYSQSLVSQETTARLHGARAAIAHIDCDLYSSAKECLDFLTGRLADGAVMLFDDWFCYRGRPDHGVHLAFDEWCQQSPYWVSDYFNYSWAGRAFIINTKE
jgi:O-methyltransferase